MYLSFNNSDKRLIITFILFSVTFFVMAMVALFIVIITSDASELFQSTHNLLLQTAHGSWPSQY